MFSKLFKPKDPIGDFWKWFQENEEKLFVTTSEDRWLWRRMLKLLGRIHPSLVFEFSMQPSPQREFAVSADGIDEAFPAVRETVAAAPTLPRWKFVAFRQANDEPLSLEMNGVRYGVDTIFYQVAYRDDQLALKIYIDGLTSKNRKPLVHATFHILDAWLGEYDVQSKLILGEFLPLSEGLDGVKPLTSLKEEMKEVPGVPL